MFGVPRLTLAAAACSADPNFLFLPVTAKMYHNLWTTEDNHVMLHFKMHRNSEWQCAFTIEWYRPKKSAGKNTK